MVAVSVCACVSMYVVVCVCLWCVFLCVGDVSFV